MGEKNELVRIVEAILFTASEPISVPKIAKAAGVNVKEIIDALKKLQNEYKNRSTSLEIIEIGKKYLMRVKPEYHKHIEKLREVDMERGTLRTLAVIAVKQPIKLSKLAEIRGNRCYEHVKKLEELGFIKTEKSGKTKIITTTKKFAEYFGIKTDKPEEVKKFLIKKDSKLENYLRDKK